jgi:hypothetical protein
MYITMSTVEKKQSEVISKPWYLSERGYHPSSLYSLWYHKRMVPAILFPIELRQKRNKYVQGFERMEMRM